MRKRGGAWLDGLAAGHDALAADATLGNIDTVLDLAHEVEGGIFVFVAHYHLELEEVRFFQRKRYFLCHRVSSVC
jgi:hypothetical protein